ncbi:hypothetical protein ACEE21_15245 [Clostridium baratii]
MKLGDLVPLIKGDYEIYKGKEYIDEYKENESVTLDGRYKNIKDKMVVSISCDENRSATKNILSIIEE